MNSGNEGPVRIYERLSSEMGNDTIGTSIFLVGRMSKPWKGDVKGVLAGIRGTRTALDADFLGRVI